MSSRTRIVTLLAVPALALSSLLAAGPPAYAATSPTLIYNYDFIGAGISGDMVPNSATQPPYNQMALTLDGQSDPAGNQCWYSAGSTNGVVFVGNAGQGQSSYCESVAYAEPPTGDESLDVNIGQAVGSETDFVYTDQANPGCTAQTDDTPNLSEAGRDSTNSTGQVKLQLSNCAAGVNTYIECRMVGVLNSAQVSKLLEISSHKLLNNDKYEASCLQIPGSSGAYMRLRLYNVTANVTYNTSATVGGSSGFGTMTSKLAVSVGNKYQMQTFPDNTDQYNGQVDGNDYCLGAADGTTTLSQMQNCLDSSIS
jgi:hypothetical protein